MEKRKRTRIGEIKKYHVGDSYRGSTIKSISEIDGNRCPTKAYYDDGTPIQTSEKGVGRVVLNSGFIHYLKPHTFVIWRMDGVANHV